MRLQQNLLVTQTAWNALNIGFAIIGLSASKNFIILARMVVLLIEICSFLLNMAKWDKKISLQRKTQHTKYLGNNI